MTAIEIRAARDDDSDAIAELLGELGYPTPPGEVGDRLAALRSPDYAVRLAVHDGRVVGLLSLHRLAGVHSTSPACYIMALVIHSTMRGRGVGKLLLGEAERWARERGCDRITVTSANYRTAAHVFYEGHGFGQTGRRFVKELQQISDPP